MIDQEVRFLYRFRPIKNYSLDELRNNYTWLSDPSSFNDPMDNPVIYNLKYLLEDCFDDAYSGKEIYNRLREAGMLKTSDLMIYLTKNEKEDMYKKVRSLMDETKTMFTEVLSHLGVVCATPCLYNRAMWAYYADSHRGFCLEYDRIDDPLFSKSKPVRYIDEADFKFPLLDFAFGKLDISEPLFSKYNDWAHEREWRAVYFYKTGDENQFRRKKGAVIKSIIFGVATPPCQVLKILNSLNDSDRKESIKFSKMEPRRDLMGMTRKEYDSIESLREEMRSRHRMMTR